MQNTHSTPAGTQRPPLTPLNRVHDALAADGRAVLDAASLAVLCGVQPQAFNAWRERWNDLRPDRYLRDGGRYRLRRHSCFVVRDAVVTLAPHRPHWQSLDYNALHGGIERHFEPMPADWIADLAWPALLRGLAGCASRLRGAQPWFVEAHPFRITTAGGIGRPTPEGAHRDGVDLVAVILVARAGIKGGETRVFDAEGPGGLRFTLDEPFSALLLDDARVIHESTPIQPLDAAREGHRDTLVLTYRAGGFQGPTT
ncbi:MAG: 2OG-Fe dioxygenase family protein [Ideonella sp.]|nr:2OG-Fe dioxygenase family protein [Ideonella sp.]MCC7456159.1 2OG-Fe dioxygenase family protein [Nitrospira sp.]